MPEIRNRFAVANRIGLGSGRTVAEFLNAASQSGLINKNAIYYPSSTQIALVAQSLGLTLGNLLFIGKLQIVVDGADQLLPDGWFIKGGGGALFREKLIWQLSTAIIILATEDKVSDTLTVPVPVEVHPIALQILKKRIKELKVSDRLRVDERGAPIITESGNMIVDLDMKNYNFDKVKIIAQRLRGIFGVQEVGLFHNKRAIIYYPKR
jgi:ribose 5-phosphate isomerase A